MRWLILLLVACGGGKQPAVTTTGSAVPPPPPEASAAATTEQCDRLLVHLVDLEFERAKGDAAQKQAVVEAKRDEFRAVCVSKTAVTRVECALAARDLDGVAKCDDAP